MENDAKMFGLRRATSGLWSARLSIPRDRWEDVGQAFCTKSGIRQDFVKSLQTKDKQEAIKRRDAALAALRTQVNEKLAEIGKPPLGGAWESGLSVTDKAVQDGLSAKKQLDAASDDYDPLTDQHGDISENVPSTEKERLRFVLTNLAEEFSQTLSPASGSKYLSTFMGVADGTETPLQPLADRWLAEESRLVTNGLLNRHKRVLAVFWSYLASVGVPLVVQVVDRRQARRFREWLQGQGKEANTVNSYLSSLRTFWTWLEVAGEVSENNPWAGMSTGLKKLAKREARARGEKRPFTEDELLLLLKGHPKSQERAQMIADMFRLGLLTGARQNELCSLTVGRVAVPDNPEELWGIKVTKEVSKTDNSVRTIPLHPLARVIVERRVQACPVGQPDAPLFPECPPGGEDNKRGWTFSKDFLRYRKAVLGASGNGTDFHSTRRCFSTFMEQAQARGVAACTPLVIDHLIGHKAERLAANTYAAKRFDWSLYSEAILGMVDKGVPESVLEALKSGKV